MIVVVVFLEGWLSFLLELILSAHKYVDIFILYYIDDDVKFDIRMVLCRLRIPKFVSHQL